jgi:hypothetical protein
VPGKLGEFGGEIPFQVVFFGFKTHGIVELYHVLSTVNPKKTETTDVGQLGDLTRLDS